MIAFLICPSVTLVRFRYLIMLLRYADKHIVNILKVCIERNNLQLELKPPVKRLTLFTFTYCETTGSVHQNLHRQC